MVVLMGSALEMETAMLVSAMVLVSATLAVPTAVSWASASVMMSVEVG